MPEITDIRPGARGSHRRRLYIDGEEWRPLPIEVVRDLGLRVGQPVETAALEADIAESEPPQAWGRVLRLLNYRDRGSDELLRRLSDDGFSPETAADAVSRAAELGFVDDRRFAEALARHLVQGKRLGRRRVASQLAAKGVSEELVAELLEDACGPEDEAARASDAAARLVAACRNAPDRVARRLVAKGFDTGIAWRAAKAACGAADLPADED